MSNVFEVPESDAPRSDGVDERGDMEHRLSRAAEAEPEAVQGAQPLPADLALPDETEPPAAGTERGTAGRSETGPEKAEVKDFDVETAVFKPPEGWHPRGPETRG